MADAIGNGGDAPPPKSWDMPVPGPKGYVRVDDYGVLRVGGTKVSLEGIVYAFREGESPESIRRDYPALTLEQVYGAILFYLSNQPEVDEYLRRQEAHWAEFRARCDASPSPVVERIRAMRRSQAGQPS